MLSASYDNIMICSQRGKRPFCLRCDVRVTQNSVRYCSGAYSKIYVTGEPHLPEGLHSSQAN